MALLAELTPRLTPKDQLKLQLMLTMLVTPDDFWLVLQELRHEHPITKLLVGRALSLERRASNQREAADMLDELELAGRMALLAEIAPQLTPQDQQEVHEMFTQFEASADFCQALQVLGYHHSISKVLVSKALTLKHHAENQWEAADMLEELQPAERMALLAEIAPQLTPQDQQECTRCSQSV